MNSIDSIQELVRRSVELNKIPRYLYKYRETDRTKNILSSSKFWFANSLSFNDPFDSDLSVDPKFRIVDLKRYIAGLGFDNAQSKDWIKRVKKNPDVFNQLYANSSEQVKKRLGTLSLSKTYRDILMWSHYADNHRGQVLELDVLSDLEFFFVPVEIDYQSSFKPLNYLKDSEGSAMRNLSTKAKSWSYEQEVRIIKKFVGLCSIKKDAITKIYFGCNGSLQDRQDIIRLCEKEGYGKAKFFQANKKYGKFELIFAKIS